MEKTETKRRGRPSKIETYSRKLEKGDRFLKKWEFRSRRNGAEKKTNIVEQQQAKARALTGLHTDAQGQIELIRISQLSKEIIDTYPAPEGEDTRDLETRRLVNQATDIDSRAKGLFILCHTGFVENFITPHINRFDNARGEQNYHSIENIREDLRAAAQSGLAMGMERFDCDSGNKPMTYMRFWMQHRVGQEVERMSKIFRAKGKTTDLVAKIEEVVKEIRTEGRHVTLEEVAKKTDTDVARIAQVMSLATEMPVRLDAAPKTSEDGATSIGDLIVDDRQNVEDPVIDAHEKAWLAESIEKLDNDFYKRVLQLYYGIGDNVGVPQNVLYDGVYVDKDGNRFSAEQSVLENKVRIANGEKIQKEKQSVLNQKFKAGELVFEPGSVEAHELARVSKGPVDLSQDFERYITNETGVPPRSGTVQNAIKEAVKELQKMAVDEGLIES